MSFESFKLVVVVMLVLIILLSVFLSITNKSKKSIKRKDTFRSEREIGAENVGEVSNEISYRELAKARNLPEARKLKRRPNPDVTRHISATATLLKEHHREHEGEK